MYRLETEILKLRPSPEKMSFFYLRTLASKDVLVLLIRMSIKFKVLLDFFTREHYGKFFRDNICKEKSDLFLLKMMGAVHFYEQKSDRR